MSDTAVRDSKYLAGVLRHNPGKIGVELDTATKVGARHGKPAVLVVAAARMHEAGHEFFRSTNGVWLTEHVAPEYLSVTSAVSPASDPSSAGSVA